MSQLLAFSALVRRVHNHDKIPIVSSSSKEIQLDFCG